MTFLLVNFAAKNAMFRLNENNRFVMAQHPSTTISKIVFIIRKIVFTIRKIIFPLI